MNEREILEDLLRDAEATVAKIKAKLAALPAEGVNLSESASAAIERIESQKTSNDTGNY